jgi:hypothetical protein
MLSSRRAAVLGMTVVAAFALVCAGSLVVGDARQTAVAAGAAVAAVAMVMRPDAGIVFLLLWIALPTDKTNVQIGSASGAEVAAGLPVGYLPLTLMVGLAVAQPRYLGDRLRLGRSFVLPWALFLGLAAISWFVGRATWDPAVPSYYRRLPLELAQIALYILPLAVIMATWCLVRTPVELRMIYGAMQALAAASWLHLLGVRWIPGFTTDQLVVVIPVFLAELLGPTPWRRRLWLAFLSLPCVIFVAHSAKLAHIVYLVLGFAGVLLVSHWRRGLPAALAVVAVGLAVTRWVGAHPVERIDKEYWVGGSDFRRHAMYAVPHLQNGLAQRVFGVGPGHGRQYYHTKRPYECQTPHSQYGDLWLETGLAGLLALLCILWRLGTALLDAARRMHDPQLRHFVTGAFGTVVGVAGASTGHCWLFPTIGAAATMWAHWFVIIGSVIGLTIGMAFGAAEIAGALEAADGTRAPTRAAKGG